MKVRITKVPDKSLNARKWKHDEGGEIEREPDDFTVRDNTYVSSLIPRGFGFNPAEERPLPSSLGQARWDDGITGAFPFIGDALQGAQAIRDFRHGDPVTGFQTAGMLLIPNIAEKAVRGLLRKSTALSALDDAASGPPPTLLEKMRKIREKAEAQRALSGDIPDPARTVLSPEELGVEKNIPQEIKERLYHSSMERMRRQRPEMDRKELGHKFGDVTNRTYREYPRSTFDKAGVDSRIKGRHYDNGHIAMPDDAGDMAAKSIGHELRHELDYQVSLTENEKLVLFDAYGDDFDNTGHGGKSPKVLKKEEVTTNYDARNTLLGDKISLSTDEQNALIDAATPEQIGMAVYRANAYGSSFMKKIVDEKKWTMDRVNKIKEAMKTVGAVSGAAAISRALYNDENLPVQLADGGELYRGSEFMYNPQPEVSEETPVPYSPEGYKEQQFYDNPANRITYLVQPGDTSWGIANRSGVPLGTLLKMNPDIGTGEKIYPGQKLAVGYKEYVPDNPKQKIETSDDNMYYSVQKGDYLGKIAKDNGMSLESLLKLNPQFVGRENQINIGEKVNIGTPSVGKNRQFKTMKERREWEAGLDNIGAIQNYKHDKNYAIVDKNAQTLTVYGPDNKIVRRFHVNTGSSNEDYNTKTYEDEKGHILYGQGNMSTPAGITEIVSVGNDYGHNSFVRARVGNDGKVRKVRDSEGNLVNDTIASSIHYEKGLYGPNASNGCIRMDGKDVDALKDYLGVGSRVYTLPQSRKDDGSAKSWFKLEDGKLSFYASDPVGETDNTGFEPQPVYEKGKIKKDKDGNIVYRDFAAEDDYNQSVDMTASPLYSSYRVENNASEYERNRAIFSTTLADNKQEFMKELIANKIGVNSDTYNRLAELAMAIANQESEFGSGTTFIAKSSFPNVVRKMKGEEGAMSIGATQMKYAGYNDEVKKILENIGINTSQDTRSQWDIANSAKATLALLAYFYNEQLTPSHRRKLRSQGMTEEEALAMMFNGKSVKWLEDFTSDPDWRSKTHIVPSLPGGLFKKHFNKEALVADYANKAVNYLTENESFYRKSGGLIERYSPEQIRAAIAKLKEAKK